MVLQLTPKSGPSRAGSKRTSELREQRWLFWGILSNSFNLYCKNYYLEAHEYEKVNQVFLFSATMNFLSLWISFRFICILLFLIVVCTFIILDPPRDHLPQEYYFWHWAQSHTIHAEEPAATRECIFLPPFSSFGRKCRLEVSGLLKTMLLPSTAPLIGPGDSQTTRDISA